MLRFTHCTKQTGVRTFISGFNQCVEVIVLLQFIEQIGGAEQFDHSHTPITATGSKCLMQMHCNVRTGKGAKSNMSNAWLQ